MGDDVDKANSTWCVFGTLNFAKHFHVHDLIILSVELGGLETGYYHLCVGEEFEA